MIQKACPRCKRLIAYGRTYCDACAPIAAAEWEATKEANVKKRAAIYSRRRDPKYQAFYRSKEWRTLSKAYLQAAGYKCQAKLDGCQGLAVEVHHIEPIQTPTGWAQRFEWSNLEAVCTSCHNRRRSEESGRSIVGVIDLRLVKR